MPLRSSISTFGSVAALLGLLLGSAGLGALGQSAVSPVVGVQKITANPGGATFFGAPLHQKPVYAGRVSSVSAAGVSVSGTPGWTAGQFGPVDGFKQYLVILVRDASASPGNAGDWWLITANDASSMTVDTSFLSPVASLAPGDSIEIRPLTSVADIFGTGAATILRPNLTGAVQPSVDDVIRRVEGTFFTEDIFYYAGPLAPAGYYTGGGDGPLDGSTITFKPDEPIMFFRHGSPANLASVGRVQLTPLTHFLTQGATSVTTGYPAGAAIGEAQLLEAGWTSNLSGVPNAQENDILRVTAGTFFIDDLFHYTGPAAPHGWYAGAGLADSYLLEGARAYVAFVRNPSGLIWRQPAPF